MATESKNVVFYVTDKGRALGRLLVSHWVNTECVRFSADRVRSEWAQGNKLIFVMATGIVVRTIAPFLESKQTDPAVVVLDENGSYAISLLSGHVGGANDLARDVARIVGGQPVITTASDVSGLPAIDLWARGNHLSIENTALLPTVGTKLINNRCIALYSEVPLDPPDSFYPVGDVGSADIVVTDRIDIDASSQKKLVLRPKSLIAGIGCNSGTSSEEIEAAVRTVLEKHSLSFSSLALVATVDKKGREPGLVAFAAAHSLPIMTFTADELNGVPNVAISEAARKAIGAKAVAEPAALLASGKDGRLIVPKVRWGNVTVAIVRSPFALPFRDILANKDTPKQNGFIYVIGTGPGRADYITPRALRAIAESDVIVGYGTYLDLISGLIEGKQVVSTGMAQEIDRCCRAIELAREGRTVAVVSGGDPGIFAMAGLVLDLLKKDESYGEMMPDVEIIPGISALNACAAQLGAPLMHDFVAVSLSDRLTSWETIERRLDAAAGADFVIVLYNPRSKGRSGHIEKARDIIARHRTPQTPVGIVKGAMRQNESVILSTVGSMPFQDIDMQTTVIIGNSKTTVWNGRMITPRGYEKKKAWK
jgi:cobalt-precorrin 5A hydrolase / precorrin-3B C17-methyltransferase